MSSINPIDAVGVAVQDILTRRSITSPPKVEPNEELVRECQKKIIDRMRGEGIDPEPWKAFDQVTRSAVRLRLAEIIPRFRRQNRGIILFGRVGCGKTTLMRKAFSKTRTVFLSAIDVIGDWELYGPESFSCDKRNLSDRDVILDDLGAEKLSAARFGSYFDMSEWLEWRYRCFKERGRLTFITTNIEGPNVIRDRYSERILSRLMEMCEGILYDGPDRRLKRS